MVVSDDNDDEARLCLSMSVRLLKRMQEKDLMNDHL